METTPRGPVVARLTSVAQGYRHGLRRRFEPVLTDVDLELRGGACAGLVGPNGAGKSTLLRLLAGLERPTAGTVEVLGLDATSARARGSVGFLSEESTFPPELSAAAALDLFAALSGMSGRERRVRVSQALEEVELGEARGKRLCRFSRGMLRRFGLAQAFLGDPPLVLLDEPTAGLDAPGYPILEAAVRRACAAGACVVLCTHQLADLADLAETVHVVMAGRLVRSGAADEVAPHGLSTLYRELSGA